MGADWGIELISSVIRAGCHVLIRDRLGYQIVCALISALENKQGKYNELGSTDYDMAFGLISVVDYKEYQ